MKNNESIKSDNVKLWSERSTCRLCGSSHLQQKIELPSMPIATPNFAVDENDPAAKIFSEGVPMPIDVCSECKLIQIRYIGNPEVQYRNYVYKTTMSLGLPQHFIDSAKKMVMKLSLELDSNIVEFGSNDGTYLKAFKSLNMNVVGIDPAKQIAEEATRNGIKTYSDFFSIDLANTISSDLGKADLLVANNVIANIDNLGNIFDAVNTLLSKDGVFVFETQYGRDVLDKYLLDTIYHEHLTYFTINPLCKMLPKFGLEVFDVENIPTKGGSIRVYVQKNEGSKPVNEYVNDLNSKELKDNIYSDEYFQKFEAGIKDRAKKIQKLIKANTNNNQSVAGYGASVGTLTLLGQLDLSDKVNLIVDDDYEHKATYLYGPNYQIPIKSPAALLENNVELTLVFAWRYIDSIKEKNKEYIEKGGKFLLLLPTPEIV